MNGMKTTMLMGLMTGILVVFGQLLGGNQGALIALGVAAAMNFFAYWTSDKMALARYKAQPLSPESAPELYAMVGRLAQRAELPMPRVYLIPSNTPNAFATGRNPENAVVAVTQGIVEILDRDELAGVIGHELGHIKNRDILLQSIAATLGGAVTMLATWGRYSAMTGGGRRGGGPQLMIMALLAPFAAMLIKMAISRTRDFMAAPSPWPARCSSWIAGPRGGP